MGQAELARSPRVEKALRFIADRHGDQKRKYTGEPYWIHPQKVALLVSNLTSDEDVIIGALLHDVVEDTDTTLAEIYAEFGDRVGQLVFELTDKFTRERYPKMPRKDRKAREARRMRDISFEAKLIKICDIMDNASTIGVYDPDFAKVWVPEKLAALQSMMDY